MFIEAIHARARGPPLAGHFLATYIDVMDLAYFDGRFKPKQKQKTSADRPTDRRWWPKTDFD